MPFLQPERRQHVGMDKYKIVNHDFNHFTLGPSSKGKPAAKMAFTLAEPEQQLNPSFNVLYVRTQKPTLLRLPLVRMFLDTWAETVELVRPIFRLGIPESSLKDKCKWWREDGSPLPTTPSVPMQRLMKALDSETFGATRRRQHALAMQQHHHHQQQAAPLAPGAGATAAGPALKPAAQAPGVGAVAIAAGAAAAAAHGASAHGEKHGHGHGHGHGKHHLTPFQEKEEFVEAVTPWVVLGLNVAAWCYLGSSANKPPPGM